MLLDWAKNKDDEKRATDFWTDWNFKNGHKEITPENFLDLGFSYIVYEVTGKQYQGYFNQQEETMIFFVLDYFDGKILSVN